MKTLSYEQETNEGQCHQRQDEQAGTMVSDDNNNEQIDHRYSEEEEDDYDDEVDSSVIDDDELLARSDDDEDDESDTDDDNDDDDESDHDDNGDANYCTYKGCRNRILQVWVTPEERRAALCTILRQKPMLTQVLREQMDRIIPSPHEVEAETGTTKTKIDKDECDDDDETIIDYLSKIYRILKMSLFHDFNNEVFGAAPASESSTAGQDPFGINIDRDTFEQVSASIRLFPFVLKETYRGLLPIAWQFGNRKSTPFIFLLVQLGIELEQFSPKERGGLITRKYNVLVGACCIERYYKATDVEYQSIVDSARLDVLRDLRQHNLLFKEDIDTYSLITTVLKEPIFPQRRFRYLVNWDPIQLSKPINVSDMMMAGPGTALTPLHYSMITPSKAASAIDMFRTVLEMSYKFYPKRMGYMFHSMKKIDCNTLSGNNSSSSSSSSNSCFGIEDMMEVDDERRTTDAAAANVTTPYRMACDKFTTKTVLDIVDEIVRCNATTNHHNNEICDDSLKLFHSQFIHAIMNNDVHFEGVYRLLRTDPSVLKQSLKQRQRAHHPNNPSSLSTTTTTTTAYYAQQHQPGRQKIVGIDGYGGNNKRRHHDVILNGLSLLHQSEEEEERMMTSSNNNSSNNKRSKV